MHAMIRGRSTSRTILLIGVFAIAWATQAHAQDGYQTPPAALVDLVDAPLAPGVSLSPDGTHLLLMTRQALPTIADLAKPELRLAGLRINPRNSGPSRTRYFTSLTFLSLSGGEETLVTGIPDRARISNVAWAPDSRHVSFTVTLRDRIDLYLAELSTARARKLIDRAVNAVYYGAVAWAPDGETLLVRTVEEDRGPAPEAPEVPSSPVIQENIGKVAPVRTYQDLLKNPHDVEVFAYFMRNQVLRVGIDGRVESFGEPGIITRTSHSPDGRYVLTYLVTSGRFPRRIEIRSASGDLVKLLDDLPLAEEVPTGSGSVATGKRSISWRQDADATLYWVEALDGGDSKVDAELRDEVFELAQPFEGAPTSLIQLPLRYAGTFWSSEGFALISETWRSTRTRRMYMVDLAHPGAAAKTIFDYSYEDRYNDPGSPQSATTPRGTRLLLTADGGSSIYLSGTGASPEGNRPFIRKMNLVDGQTEELFRSEAPYYERPVAWIDLEKGTLLTRRQSASEPPNYFVRDVNSGSIEAVTHFPHPYPELDAVTKEFIKFERADGVQLSATLYLPAGYDAATDGPLPTFLWAYPREFKSAAAAGQVSTSPYMFKRVSYSGAIAYVTQGYAILDNASMPIVGEGDEEPNDTFVKQLRMNAEAAVEEGARRGVVDPDRVAIGGHSYGAFMTANLLAHSDVFRAGIARSGAYNRSLTPFGFQAEPRTFWEAPEIYFAMSPFMNADKVNEPLLMIHGIADNNSGTFPIQSERFYHALKGMGKTVRLVMFPHESHGYRARESVLHTMWETLRWLETYVKNAPPRKVDVRDPMGD